MTEQEQRIAIAEFDGFEHWKVKDRPVVYLRRPGERKKKYWLSCGDTIRPDLPITQDITPVVPDYLRDLNAMAQAEEKLDEADQVQFLLRLNEVARKGKPIGEGVRQWDNVHATAAQRAEALLKTIGKWKD
jgi:hypothetical protein